MTVQQKEKAIPRYSLKESSIQGNAYFEILKANGEFVKRRTNFLTPHRKDYYLFVLVRSGGSKHWVDFTPYVLKPDTFYFTTPHQVHLKEKSAPLEGTLLSFSEEFLQLDDSKLLKTLPIILNQENHHELQLQPEDVAFIDDIMNKMLQEHHASKDWQSSMLQSYLKVLVIYLSRLYTEQFETIAPADRIYLKKFKDLIEQNFTRLHQVSDYAREMKITAGHLNDIVKEQSGRSAIEHIHQRLIVEAKHFLLHTELSSKEIAYELGFEDSAYFGRFFKRLTDTTPVLFRKHIRDMYH